MKKNIFVMLFALQFAEVQNTQKTLAQLRT
jgi:hypothetical protein